jgi:hypothetical protein
VNSPVERLAATLLYEGYLLYPYRRSSVKNQQRFTFGNLVPPPIAAAIGGSWWMQTECLVEGAQARVGVTVRFLHLHECEDGWQEAEERSIVLAPMVAGSAQPVITAPIECPASGSAATRQVALKGRVKVSTEVIAPSVHRLTVRVENLTPGEPTEQRSAFQLRSFASTHTLLTVEAGGFVSLLEPPSSLIEAAKACQNIGTWPVLVGAAGARDTMLSSPIILYDYPQIAAESPGDLFDATEIDEILTLRILTMTETEKAEMRATDPRGRALLDRTEALGAAELTRLHGAMRELRPVAPPFAVGDRVRLRPSGRADAFDLVLRGRDATIAAVEQDLEGRLHLAVTIDDDPGADLGQKGLPGHRFFFGADEVERR